MNPSVNAGNDCLHPGLLLPHSDKSSKNWGEEKVSGGIEGTGAEETEPLLMEDPWARDSLSNLALLFETLRSKSSALMF